METETQSSLIRDGDANTKKIHAIANARKKKSFISKLSNDGEDIISNHSDLCNLARNYFESLYSYNDVDVAVTVDHVEPKLTMFDNVSLVTPFEKWEFKEAAFQMHSNKSPGPDGFNPTFYKWFWDLLGDYIFNNGVA